MSDSNPGEITILLERINQGDTNAPEEILPLVYDELRKLAHSYMQNERSDHTLQATALVHEAFIRVIDWKNISWESRAQFFAIVAQVMRNVLIDYARSRNSQKRFGGQKIVLDDAVSFPNERGINLLKLEEALNSLEKLDARQAKIIELRFFGGLSIEETAHVLQISDTTVKREWRFAKTWLQRELTQ
jgi:RNA polymerase sigma factor (TIGR02999 family)